jgi:hypothetical protein
LTDLHLDSVTITEFEVPAGEYVVIGTSSTSGTNGGVDVAYAYALDFPLSTAGDEIIITSATGVEVDRVAFDDGTEWPNPVGASMQFGGGPADDNNTPVPWCEGHTSLGDGDLGTPGETNDCTDCEVELVDESACGGALDCVCDGLFNVGDTVTLAVDSPDGHSTTMPCSVTTRWTSSRKASKSSNT